MKPVADVFPFAVYRKFLVSQRTADDERNEFLREMVRAVVVGASGDGYRKPVSPIVSQNKEVRAGFG